MAWGSGEKRNNKEGGMTISRWLRIGRFWDFRIADLEEQVKEHLVDISAAR